MSRLMGKDPEAKASKAQEELYYNYDNYRENLKDNENLGYFINSLADIGWNDQIPQPLEYNKKMPKGIDKKTKKRRFNFQESLYPGWKMAYETIPPSMIFMPLPNVLAQLIRACFKKNELEDVI